MSNKGKHAFWLSPETKRILTEEYKNVGCDNQSDFVEKAVRFYYGYCTTNQIEDYLPKILRGMLEGYLGQFTDRMGKLLFKLAVEQAICNHLLAAWTRLSSEKYEELHRKGEYDVRRSNGQISFEEIRRFQNGD